jgi:Ca2+-binding EF-hand superfamily protein
MALPLLLIAAAAAFQSQPATAPAQRPGRPFMSPMGEPVFGRTAGEDGLVAWFQDADRNHDGSLTVDEMQADADRFFQTLDTNHDGEIDPDEISHYEQVIAPQVHARAILIGDRVEPAGVGAARGGRNGGGDGKGGGRRGGGGSHLNTSGGGLSGGFGGNDEYSAGRYGLLQIPEPVASADADFNRGVSAEEFRRAATQRFRLLDSAGTGKLTLPELQGVHEAAASAARRGPPSKPDPDGSNQADQLDPEGDTDSSH